VVRVVFSPCGNYLAAANSRPALFQYTISIWSIDFTGNSEFGEVGFGDSNVIFKFLCSDTQLFVRTPNLSLFFAQSASISLIPSGESGKPRSDVSPLLHQDDITALSFQPPLMEREVQIQLEIRAERQAALERRKGLKEIKKKGKDLTNFLLLRRAANRGDDSSEEEEDDKPFRFGGVCRALARG